MYGRWGTLHCCGAKSRQCLRANLYPKEPSRFAEAGRALKTRSIGDQSPMHSTGPLLPGLLWHLQSPSPCHDIRCHAIRGPFRCTASASFAKPCTVHRLETGCCCNMNRARGRTQLHGCHCENIPRIPFICRRIAKVQFRSVPP